MSNPFPGMDPFLEGDLWTSVHTDLSAEIARQLAPKVRPKYFVLTARRVVLAPSEEAEQTSHWFPDVGILTGTSAFADKSAAVARAPLVLPTDFPEPIPHISVEIRDVAERRLVTCIEVLSPTNKTGIGREEYANKRYQMLSSTAHLVEIDLLRAGARFPTGKPLPRAAYFVFVSRAERRRDVEVWPIPLESPLPEAAIPLLPGDADVGLDLQKALTTVYDILGYDELIDYQTTPPGELSTAEKAWLSENCSTRGGVRVRLPRAADARPHRRHHAHADLRDRWQYHANPRPVRRRREETIQRHLALHANLAQDEVKLTPQRGSAWLASSSAESD